MYFVGSIEPFHSCNVRRRPLEFVSRFFGQSLEVHEHEPVTATIAAHMLCPGYVCGGRGSPAVFGYSIALRCVLVALIVFSSIWSGLQRVRTSLRTV